MAPDSKPAVNITRLLTARDCAAVLNISVETLKSWRARGYGPEAIKMDNGHIRYSQRAVMEYIAGWERVVTK